MAFEVCFAIPGDPDTLTGGFIYDKRMIEALRAGAMPVRVLIWPANFPSPAEDDQARVAASLTALPDGSIVLIDGLAFGALPGLMMAEAERLRLVALVHHPLGYETGLPPELRRRLIESERRALPAARRVVTTSDMTARSLIDDFGVPPHRVAVVLPGCDRPREGLRPRRVNAEPLLLSVGAVIPRKGHDLLLRALDQLADLPWRCVIAGSLARDPMTAARLRAQLAESAVETRVTLAGDIADVYPLYGQADIFVLASYYEGYGMAYAEALRHGLPVVGTTGGAIPEVVPADAGLLSAPGDVPRLAASLRAMLTDAALRRAFAAGARRAAGTFQTWQEAANRMAGIIRDLGGGSV